MCLKLFKLIQTLLPLTPPPSRARHRPSPCAAPGLVYEAWRDGCAGAERDALGWVGRARAAENLDFGEKFLSVGVRTLRSRPPPASSTHRMCRKS
jgi:hypothetical protein